MKKLIIITIAAIVLFSSSCSLQEKNQSGSQTSSTDTALTGSENSVSSAISENSAPGSINHPLKLQQTGEIDNMNILGVQFYVKVTMTEIVRGKQADTMVADANKFNKKPGEGEEYMLVKFNVKAINTDTSGKVSLSETMFHPTGENYQDTDTGVVIDGLPTFSEIEWGKESDGYVAFILKKGETPVIRFGNLTGSQLYFETAE